jgi:hypothetical protein
MASENTSIINLVGNVTDPTQTAQPDGSTPPFTTGRQGEQLASEIHGKYYTANYRGKLFEVNATTITVPVNAATLVGVFSLLNPAGSGVNMELVDTSVNQTNATTVVDQVGWYFSSATKTAASTFATAGTVNSGMVGASPANKAQFYTLTTFNGTPVLCDVIGGYGAVTNTTAGGICKIYDGRLIVPPGISISVAMSTAAGATTGLALEARWVEWPI